MATNKTTATNYMVMGFVLELGDDSKPTQRTVHCGAFADIEEAFSLAREIAESQWRQLMTSTKEAEAALDFELFATEYGYDIRQGELVVERFWVHDKRPTEPLPS